MGTIIAVPLVIAIAALAIIGNGIDLEREQQERQLNQQKGRE